MTALMLLVIAAGPVRSAVLVELAADVSGQTAEDPAPLTLSEILKSLAGRWEGVTSTGSYFVWTIEQNGRYLSEYREAGRQMRRAGGILVKTDGSIEWRSETGQNGTLTVRTGRTGARQFRGTISGRPETFQATQVETRPATARGRGPDAPSSPPVESGTASPAISTYGAADYFVLERTGAWWEYEVSFDRQGQGSDTRVFRVMNGGQATLGGLPITAFRANQMAPPPCEASGGVSYLMATPSGIVSVARQGYGGTIVRYDPPVMTLGQPFSIGSAWTTDSKKLEGNLSTRHAFTTKVETVEKILVPAGQFESIRLRWTGIGEEGVNWRAPGVGTVRFDEKYDYGRLRTVGRLLRFNVSAGVVGTEVPMARPSGDASAGRLQIPPAPTTRVNDYASCLRAEDRQALENALAGRERELKVQMVVALFPSLRNENLEDYTQRVANQWGIGRAGVNDGVVLFVFLEDRRMRLAVGKGLEEVIRDAEAAKILQDVVAPRMPEGRVVAGIAGAVDAVFSRVALARQAEAERESAARQKAAAAELSELLRRHGAKEVVPCRELVSNPFAREGQRVATVLSFEQMSERDTAVFTSGFVECAIVAVGAPARLFPSRKVEVMLLGVVKGTTELALPMVGRTRVPQLGFLGVHMCRQTGCGEFWPR
ncbi:MAG TPA: TPM domain-containing protein [Methylomirabilota bacterium]